MRSLVTKCYFCDDWVSTDDPYASYVLPRNVTYKGKTFKGKRTYFHKDCYEKILRKNNKMLV